MSMQAPLSAGTERKTSAFKMYFLDYYFSLLAYRHKRQQRIEQFRRELEQKNLSAEDLELAWTRFMNDEHSYLRRRRLRLNFSQFTVLCKIGEGGYGEVFLCRKNDTNETCAVKRMNKKALVRRNAIEHILTERDVLSLTHSDWLVRLLYSFQDDVYVYLAMDFIPGGDLRTLLNNCEMMPEECVRFYIAQAFVAVANLHSLGFLHRDLKPENFLIDIQGHLKLTDFGMAKGGLAPEWMDAMVKKLEGARDKQFIYRSSLERRQVYHNLRREDRAMGYTVVGSPDYMAPEILQGSGYDLLVDYWALGCMMYEMIASFPPFAASDLESTFHDIIRFENTLERPEYDDDYDKAQDRLMTDQAWDLIKKLLTHRDHRYGSLAQIQSHPWFQGIVWDRLRQYEPPFVPQLSSEIDTSYFDQLAYNPEEDAAKKYKDDEFTSLPAARFIGFTFKHNWMGTLARTQIQQLSVIE